MEYINYMIKEINKTEEKFSAFADAFTLINDKGSLRFIVDYRMFFQKFMELFPNDKIQTIHHNIGERLYIYNPDDGQFHKIANTDLMKKDKVIKIAQERMYNFRPIYMNGVELVPHLNEDAATDMVDTVTYCPEPNFMKEIAQMILYKLTEKLEQDGNSKEA